MFLKPPKPRQFTYRPKFYKPIEDEEEGPRIKFRRSNSLKKPPKKQSTLLLIFVAIVLAVLLSYWLRIDKAGDDGFKFEEIDIEQLK